MAFCIIERQVPQPCHTEVKRGILESAGPAVITIRIPGSVRGLTEFMELVRRHFIELLAKPGADAL